MGVMRTVLGAIWVIGLGGVGFGLWAAVTPTEDRTRELLKNLPEANPVRMEETRKRNALMLQVIKEAAETNDNIIRGYGGQK